MNRTLADRPDKGTPTGSPSPRDWREFDIIPGGSPPMSAPFSPDNRHHLLLTEAHQVNEFLDARLAGAEVPEGQRPYIAIRTLELALMARRGDGHYIRRYFGALT